MSTLIEQGLLDERMVGQYVELDRSTDLVVVGAGILGCSITRLLLEVESVFRDPLRQDRST
jgi:hypothetical protein